ncbi:arabinan endo-1 5-alpha-L-arabinosidase [Deinococcus puniceus]|uniref:Arabinan endo-1 5-alpha-L-arabinosidase n=2 Tax=Deinococcus puniceus TaxID=1182568 RepID=A0A172T9Q9_9DEIO|nr:arabinan endo-1 5-alpha-L-arabinosidase [Deinococcus puniceus]
MLGLVGLLSACNTLQTPDKTVKLTYSNPLTIKKADGTRVESCADPAVIQSRTPGDTNWYLYCTTDPHNTKDVDANNNLNFHLISMAKSPDLVNWTYIGDAFTTKPDWVKDDAGLWAPNIEYLNGKYYLYYTASDTKARGSAIGVATSTSPTGPWTDSGTPVVEPQGPPGGNPDDRRWVFDSEVITDDAGQNWMYYGSYFGGISVRKLSADGLKTDAATQKEVAIDNRYEGAQVVKHGGFYYLMLSAANCCNGPLTGYSMFTGRSASPTGPFVDKEGVSLLDPRTGGTPLISMNGNRWVGPGHNAVFTDAGGQDWTMYHAIDLNDPYFTPGGVNKRPVLLDPLDWVDEWPTVRAGNWASDSVMPAPAAQAGQLSAYKPNPPKPDVLGNTLSAFNDDFSGPALAPRWTWVRPPAAAEAGLENGALRFATQPADLFENSNNASVLTQNAPAGDYAVDIKLQSDLPDEGCCFNYAQGGLLIYGDDDNFIKLGVTSIWNTRQIEFAKEQNPVADKFPRYGNTVLSAPGRETWLRIVRRASSVAGAGETYTAYSSRDGMSWTKGGTWTHKLGQAKIGLFSMGGAGFTSRFDSVRVYSLK